jgi:uncharacterized OB-fold protein
MVVIRPSGTVAVVDEAYEELTAEEYFRSDASGTVLCIGRCGSCARPHFPPAVACPHCASSEVVAGQLGPDGEVRQSTVVAVAPPGYEGEVPYGFGVVDVGGELEVIARLALIGGDAPSPGSMVRCTSVRVGPADQGIWEFEVSGEVD